MARDNVATPDHEAWVHGASNDNTDSYNAFGEDTTTASQASSNTDQLRVGKHVCPEEYVNAFTPMEFEEVGGFGGLWG